jgi:DNA-directed RNA polymerase specialized sigma54-like protein
MNIQISEHYLDRMQAAALSFLIRHQAEHLSNTDQLIERAVTHLNERLQVPEHTAKRLVERAYSELKPEPEHRYLDVDSSTGLVAVLVDPESGRRYRIPIAEVFAACIDDPELQPKPSSTH